MDYQTIYDKLIEKAKLRSSLIGYSEKHHIVPVCMGGSNELDNLVRLTFKEHYVAHHLLYKIHKTSKLAYAWFSMCRTSGNQSRIITSKMYEIAKKAHSDELKESLKGSGNPFYGKKHTKETLEKIRIQNIGKKASEETKKKMSNTRLGVKKTEEHKAKIGRKGLIMLMNKDTGESIRVSKEDVLLYDTDIWKNAYTIKMLNAESITCPHCNFTSKQSSTFKRWHLDNCKRKPR